MKTWMMGLFLAALVVPAGNADDSLLSFDGGIGVDPVSGIAANGAPAANVVRGVGPGGAPWRIANLTASIDVSGRISVRGRGLLLAGGNGIGTNGGQSVHARLFCGVVAHDSGLVALAPNGDFEIDGVLTPMPRDPCTNPVLLIVSAGGNWFAAGIPKLDE